MSDRTRNAANQDHRVGRPGVLLILVGVVAFVICVVGFALGWVGCGTWAGIIALLSSAAGMAWLSNEGRRQRGNQPLMPLQTPNGPRPAGTD
ncbi:hypothetical protein [Mycolicibacterium mengxianglii]|uniref:hypothetical protein n=1 Tax=Mycolicibacterium mengxianglii TaxID=2736649 RepID=UPI0018D0548B|nr:hypothetical protein [Mycolicibacterium mengxianglii]